MWLNISVTYTGDKSGNGTYRHKALVPQDPNDSSNVFCFQMICPRSTSHLPRNVFAGTEPTQQWAKLKCNNKLHSGAVKFHQALASILLAHFVAALGWVTYSYEPDITAIITSRISSHYCARTGW